VTWCIFIGALAAPVLDQLAATPRSTDEAELWALSLTE
jgi:hypothetical protein